MAAGSDIGLLTKGCTLSKATGNTWSSQPAVEEETAEEDVIENILEKKATNQMDDQSEMDRENKNYDYIDMPSLGNRLLILEGIYEILQGSNF